MLLSGKGNTLVQGLLVGAAHEGNQGVDHRIHMLNLNGFQVCKTGRNFLILRLAQEYRLIIIGLTGFVAAQTFVNIGMNIGLLPIIGITLPFVSYGGSSLVTVWLMTGLIFSVSIRRPRPPIRQSFEYGEDDE